MFRARQDHLHTVWQDREIRFDIHVAHLQPRKGEMIYDQMEDVEDTKGGSEELGTLLITNLRAIWTCKQKPRTNISIGMFCFTNMSVRDATSRIKGSALQITIQTRFNNSRFEFIFTNTRAVPRIFQSIIDVYQLYDSSRLFRDLKLRGVVVKDKDLLLLPGESTYSMVKGCWNLSSEQGNLGTFFITNIRVVWFAELAEGFNVSIPYMQMKSVKVRDSKFGTVLVVETLPQSGDYVLGFKIDPQERLQEVHQEIRSLMDVFLTSPSFGVDYQPDVNHQLNKLALDDSEQDVMIVSGQDHRDGLAMYYSEEGKSADRDPVFMPELGLACEQLREDVTLQQLWGVV